MRRLLVLVALVLAGCTTSAGEFPDATPEAPTTTTTAAPAPAGEAPDCGDPVASYAPTGALPSPGRMPGGSSMAEIAKKGRLVVGVSADTMLFGARNPFTGTIEGFDIDVLREVARAIFGDPNKIEYRVITYAQRLPVLEAHDVDLVAHTMTINCARWARIAFSSEYFHAGQKLLVPESSTAGGIEDMAGQRVCAAEGSTNIDNLAAYPDVEAVGQVDLTDCLVLFQQGAVDAITGDDTVLAGFAAQDPYAKVIGDFFTEEPYGVGVSLDRPDLVRFVNGVLDRMRTDGTWQRIHERWLDGPGTPPPAVYGRVP